MENIEEIVNYIVGQSVKLKNKYVKKLPIKIEFCDIFACDKNDDFT